jgi:DNA-binding NarL/FixJ family response regulator
VSMYVTRRTQALAAGADGFLSKGCRVEELLDAILDR